VNKTSTPWRNINETANFSSGISDIEWLLLQGKLLGKKIKNSMTTEELERWLYE